MFYCWPASHTQELRAWLWQICRSCTHRCPLWVKLGCEHRVQRTHQGWWLLYKRFRSLSAECTPRVLQVSHHHITFMPVVQAMNFRPCSQGSRHTMSYGLGISVPILQMGRLKFLGSLLTHLRSSSWKAVKTGPWSGDSEFRYLPQHCAV
jgi:hypothetical protein